MIYSVFLSIISRWQLLATLSPLLKWAPMAHTPDSRWRALRKMNRIRDAWLTANGPCRSCGSAVDLEVHHRNPAEKVAHRVWTWAEPRRMAELAKCDVVCRACHIAIHAEARKRHGIKRYKCGCRCDVCKEAKRMEYARAAMRETLERRLSQANA